MAPLHVVLSEQHFDDYKRAETTFGLVGAFSKREQALKVAILHRIEAMQEHIDSHKHYGAHHPDRIPDAISEKVRNFVEGCKGDAFDVSEAFEESEELTEELYGDPVYSTVKSSGLRYFVLEELPAVDQTIDGDILGEDVETNWVDEIKGLEAYDPKDALQESGSEGSGEESEEDDSQSEQSEDFDELEEMEQDELTLLLREAASEGAPAEMEHEDS